MPAIALFLGVNHTTAGGTTPSIAQYTSNDGVGGVQEHLVASTFASKTVAGRSIVHFCTLSDYAGAHADVITTDTQGNTWTLLEQENTSPTGGASSVISFVANGIVGDPTTGDVVTQGFSSGGDTEDYLANYILEIANVSGVVGHSGLVQNALAHGTNNINSGTAITVTAGQVPCIMVAVAVNSSGNSGSSYCPTPGTGMTLVSQTWAFGTANKSSAVAYRVITTAGSYQAIFNQAGSAAEDMACLAVILH